MLVDDWFLYLFEKDEKSKGIYKIPNKIRYYTEGVSYDGFLLIFSAKDFDFLKKYTTTTYYYSPISEAYQSKTLKYLHNLSKDILLVGYI